MTSSKRVLNDRIVHSLRPADNGTRYDVWDAIIPNLGVRVSANGSKSFIIATRFPGKRNPTRRSLGAVGKITLAAARSLAREWLQRIAAGVDPAASLPDVSVSERPTFSFVIEEYIKLHVIGPDKSQPRQRKGAEVARELRTLLVPIWGDRVFADLKRSDLMLLIETLRDHGTVYTLNVLTKRQVTAVSRAAPGQARNILGYIKALFNWAADRGIYGIEVSPFAQIRSSRLVGEKQSRERVLTKDEIFLFWRAACRTPYPYGPLYKLLLLTGLRLNEVADARWSEFHFDDDVWIIPSARMKGRNGKALQHVVPLTMTIRRLLLSLPRFASGEFVFSSNAGGSPVWVNSKVKARLDAKMNRTSAALARRRHVQPEAMPPWVNHDLRRTMRSEMSRLRVRSDVAEALLAHAKPGIEGVYNRYDLLEEKVAALRLWGEFVESLAQSSPISLSAWRLTRRFPPSAA